MTDPLPRPVPRYLHVWAVVVALGTVVLLAIGQLVTSFGAGMADRVWPTEPWYVFHTATESEKARFKQDFAFIIEHSHRIAGWTIGILSALLALGLWTTEPRKTARWVVCAGLVVMLGGYLQFHRELMLQRQKLPSEVQTPFGSAGIALVGLVVVLGVAITGVSAGSRGAGVRLIGALALVAVMIQGLLGGFRVMLDAWFGADLAAFHGVFAQVVFGLLVMLAAYTARPLAPTGDPAHARRLWHGANAFAHLVFIQVVFGALVRHFPTPLSQRLHFVTAFLATGVAVWLLRAVLTDPDARRRAGRAAWVLAGLIVFQLYIGVEAWLAKFGAYKPPELVPVTAETGAIRTLHALVGSGVWAMALVLAIRLRPVRLPANTTEPIDPARPEPTAQREVGAVGVLSGDAK
jgi:heme a synthase